MEPSNAARRQHKAIFAGDAASVLYELMLELDLREDLDEHPIRKTDAYHAAVRGLGWDIDWAEIAERRNA